MNIKERISGMHHVSGKEATKALTSGVLLGIGFVAEKMSPGSATAFTLTAAGIFVGFNGAFRTAYEAGEFSAQHDKD